MSPYESVFTAATQLPVEERLRLISDLASTVPNDHPPTLSPEWQEEVSRRWDEIVNGKVATIPWETVRDEMFARVGISRAT